MKYTTIILAKKTNGEVIKKYSSGFSWVKYTDNFPPIYTQSDNIKRMYCLYHGDKLYACARITNNEFLDVNVLELPLNYIIYVQDFLEKNYMESDKYKFNHSVRRNGKMYNKLMDMNLVYVGDKLYTVFNLPKNASINGSLILDRVNYKLLKLPEGLTINGDLELRYLYNEFEFELPKGLVVKKNAPLSGAWVKLSEGMIVEGDLNLSNSKIKELPDNLTVGGLLDISGTNIDKIGNNIKFGDIKNIASNVKNNNGKLEFANNISVFEGDLEVSHKDILSDNLTVKGNLIVDYSNMEKLPKGLVVEGDFSIREHNEITELPEDLIVNGELNIEKPIKLPQIINAKEVFINSRGITLPKGLIVNGDLNLNRPVSLPDNLTVKGTLNTFNFTILNVGKNIKCKELKSESLGIDSNGNIVTKNDLLKSTSVYEGNFIADNSITEIPEGLTINGDLSVTNSMTELPKNLTINGNLYLSHSSIIKLSKKLNVIGNIILSGTKIKLPKGFVANKDLIMQEYQLRSLPEGLTVKGNLDLSGSDKIKKLPEGLVVKGDLNLTNTSINVIPNSITVNGKILNKYGKQVAKEGCVLINGKSYDVNEIPEGITVEHKLNLYGSKIAKLPNNLTVNGDLDLSSCSELTKLPKNLTVNGWLRFPYTKITTIPNDLKVNGTLTIDSNIDKIPDNLVVNGELQLVYSKIELPNNLTVNGKLFLLSCNIKKIGKKIKYKELNIYDSNVIEKNGKLVIKED